MGKQSINDFKYRLTRSVEYFDPKVKREPDGTLYVRAVIPGNKPNNPEDMMNIPKNTAVQFMGLHRGKIAFRIKGNSDMFTTHQKKLFEKIPTNTGSSGSDKELPKFKNPFAEKSDTGKPEPKMVKEKDKETICKASTLDGKGCKRPTLNGKRCWQHK